MRPMMRHGLWTLSLLVSLGLGVDAALYYTSAVPASTVTPVDP